MTTERAANGKTILVVEDNDVTRAGVTVLLQRAGYDVATARDGQQALDYLRSKRPTLILLDMLLPVLDGWHFLTELQNWSKPLNTPIIITTGTCLSREWAREHGCAGFIRKPIELEALLAEIQRCLG
jgi:CheY-like chemotaxis protein